MDHWDGAEVYWAWKSCTIVCQLPDCMMLIEWLRRELCMFLCVVCVPMSVPCSWIPHWNRNVTNVTWKLKSPGALELSQSWGGERDFEFIYFQSLADARMEPQYTILNLNLGICWAGFYLPIYPAYIFHHIRQKALNNRRTDVTIQRWHLNF